MNTEQKTLLLIDDEPILIEVIHESLEDHGFRVFSATHPKQGLDLLAQHPEIDLLITDIQMPQMSGIEVAMQVQARFPQTKIALMTGYSSFTDEQYRQAGALFVIRKPFSIDELVALIRKHI